MGFWWLMRLVMIFCWVLCIFFFNLNFIWGEVQGKARHGVFGEYRKQVIFPQKVWGAFGYFPATLSLVLWFHYPKNFTDFRSAVEDGVVKWLQVCACVFFITTKPPADIGWAISVEIIQKSLQSHHGSMSSWWIGSILMDQTRPRAVSMPILFGMIQLLAMKRCERSLLEWKKERWFIPFRTIPATTGNL